MENSFGYDNPQMLKHQLTSKLVWCLFLKFDIVRSPPP